MVDPFDDTYRRQMNRQLTIQESRHKLTPDICHGMRGQQAYRARQDDQLGALGLVLNAAVLWTTRYLDAALTALQALLAEQRDHPVPDEDVALLSPLKHANRNVPGRYGFRASTPVSGAPRSPRAPAADEDESAVG
ncbi:Tn3 family transposase [Streptomyces sp. DSM 41699]|uniref:Tn3 family transposase n=1 Tax=Streptomyces gibsoniae TaxID=3075529 RepID=A0ABU2U8B8_9ACTN|nr:Tn3 family transposase [Streptomyces sp. DSM 41699]MDT0469276.1 Tn3 family transposase [Streptomyces sp. DSM 41699]